REGRFISLTRRKKGKEGERKGGQRRKGRRKKKETTFRWGSHHCIKQKVNFYHTEAEI
ncbi:mCG144509, partial [Mus musculus]